MDEDTESKRHNTRGCRWQVDEILPTEEKIGGYRGGANIPESSKTQIKADKRIYAKNRSIYAWRPKICSAAKLRNKQAEL